jgi:hypothetical protein
VKMRNGNEDFHRIFSKIMDSKIIFFGGFLGRLAGDSG